jgi:hypothetical protein
MLLPASVHMEKSLIVMLVQGALSAQAILMGPRLEPFSAVPCQD